MLRNRKATAGRHCTNGVGKRSVHGATGRIRLDSENEPSRERAMVARMNAKRDRAGASHVVRVPGRDGEEHLAICGAPQKTTLGKKLAPLAVRICPESRVLGHTPEEAYEYAAEQGSGSSDDPEGTP